MTIPDILTQTNFTTLDWVIVIIYPLISLGIGIYVSRFIKNMNDFVCAGKGLGTALGIATLTGTELGLITVMYIAQKGFGGAFATFHIALIAGVVTFLVGASGFILYRLREMEVLTIPEFYERRFDKKTRILGGIMMALGGILNMGLFLKIGSMFIVGITGLSDTGWALPTVMIFLITLVLIYTCLGGMVSVVISDYVQFCVLSFGMIVACFLAVRGLGEGSVMDGWNNIFTTVEKFKGEAGFDPTVSGSGFGFEYITFTALIGLVSCAIWPTSVSRALAADSPKTVKKQFTFGSISFMIRFLIPAFWGICAYVWIMTDKTGALQGLFFPQAGSGVEPVNNLYAMPMFLGQILPAGLIGLITAAMLAAFMSTHDSYLLCWSSVLTQDVIAPLMGDKLTPKTRIKISRVLIVVIGIWVLGWGLLYKGSLDIFDYMGVTGAIYFAGAFALLVGGLYWKKASSNGAFLALIAGSTAVLGLFSGVINETDMGYKYRFMSLRSTLNSCAPIVDTVKDEDLKKDISQAVEDAKVFLKDGAKAIAFYRNIKDLDEQLIELNDVAKGAKGTADTKVTKLNDQIAALKEADGIGVLGAKFELVHLKGEEGVEALYTKEQVNSFKKLKVEIGSPSKLMTGARAALISIVCTVLALVIGSLVFPDKENHAGAVKELADKSCKQEDKQEVS